MIHISPAIAIKLSPQFSIGAGIHYIMAGVELERYMDIDTLVGMMTFGAVTDVDDVHFEADVSNEVITFYGGFQWDITPDITLGAVYHSGTDVDFEGDVTFNQPVTGIAAVDLVLTALFPEITGNTALPIIDQIMVGLAFKAGEKLDLEIDVNFAMWSQYESLDLAFEAETSFFGIPIVANASAPKDWKNTTCVRFGGEYHASKKMDIRFGILYDTNPVPDETLDPMLPDNDRFGLTTGFGYKANGFTIDFAYMLLLQAERSSTNDVLAPLDQNYEAGQAHLFSLSLGLVL